MGPVSSSPLKKDPMLRVVPPGENHLVPSGRSQTLDPAPPHPATVSAVSRPVAVEASGWAGQPEAWDFTCISSAKQSVGLLLRQSNQPDFTHLPSVKKSSKSGLGHVKLSTNYLTIQLDSTVFYTISFNRIHSSRNPLLRPRLYLIPKSMRLPIPLR